VKSIISYRLLFQASGCATEMYYLLFPANTRKVRTHADVGIGNVQNPGINTVPVLTRGNLMVNIDTGYCCISLCTSLLTVYNVIKKGFAMKQSGLYTTFGLSDIFFHGKHECTYTLDNAATSFELVHISGIPDYLIARATG